MNVSLQLALKSIQDEATKPLHDEIRTLKDQLAKATISDGLLEQLLYDVEMLISDPGDVEYPDLGVHGEIIEGDVPFWSEGALYELVGKEAARTLLARQRQVNELVHMIRSIRSKR